MVGQSNQLTGTSNPDICELSGTSEQRGQMADSKHPSQCTMNSPSIVKMKTKGGGSSEIDDTGDPKLLKIVPLMAALLKTYL